MAQQAGFQTCRVRITKYKINAKKNYKNFRDINVKMTNELGITYR